MRRLFNFFHYMSNSKRADAANPCCYCQQNRHARINNYLERTCNQAIFFYALTKAMAVNQALPCRHNQRNLAIAHTDTTGPGRTLLPASRDTNRMSPTCINICIHRFVFEAFAPSALVPKSPFSFWEPEKGEWKEYFLSRPISFLRDLFLFKTIPAEPDPTPRRNHHYIRPKTRAAVKYVSIPAKFARSSWLQAAHRPADLPVR